jgi:hypothetical protein
MHYYISHMDIIYKSSGPNYISHWGPKFLEMALASMCNDIMYVCA